MFTNIQTVSTYGFDLREMRVFSQGKLSVDNSVIAVFTLCTPLKYKL